MASSSQRRGASRSSPSGSQHPQHRTMPQSSPSGSHQPNVSQPSKSAGDNTLPSSNGKLPIIAHADGRVTGVYSAKWSSRVGYWIRAIVPISYASWDKVDGSFKDEVWLKLMNCESEQEAISSCPTGLIQFIGKHLQSMRTDKEVKDMMKFNPEKKHRRTDSWKYGHKHRDGTVLERAQEYYDKGSRTRGLSSCMSNKQLQTFAMVEELVEQESSSKSKLEDELAEVKSTVGNLLASQTRMETMMAGILEHVKLNGSTNGQPSTPTTEVDSTLVPAPRDSQVPNLINRNGYLNPPSRTSYPM
ncbi:hypothetical protein IFM89_019066 [Coptis chinensis]|uniref:Uncharacterized protein n=1 Tax=Coptis chinensis TaxID=261450 RepID=A0A835IX47_9MAGN|nr:hypothetical protein IFM89_019066 [Coptis chinensis]